MHIELTENEKNELAKDCGYSEERRLDMIKIGVKQQYCLEDELAMDRKTIMTMIIRFNKLLDKLNISINDAGSDNIKEFTEYFEKVESIKNDCSEV